MNRFTSTILFCLAAALVLLTVTGNHGLLHLQKINKELQLIEGKNRELKSDIQVVQRDIQAIHRSDFALEKKAREELGLSRSDEIVYIFPNTSENIETVE